MSSAVSDTIALIGAASMVGMGLLMLVRPERWQVGRSKARERQLEDRLRRGTDAYFEERRTLEAYSKPFDPRSIRIFGGGILILSVATIFLRFIKP